MSLLWPVLSCGVYTLTEEPHGSQRSGATRATKSFPTVTRGALPTPRQLSLLIPSTGSSTGDSSGSTERLSWKKQNPQIVMRTIHTPLHIFLNVQYIKTHLCSSISMSHLYSTVYKTSSEMWLWVLFRRGVGGEWGVQREGRHPGP